VLALGPGYFLRAWLLSPHLGGLRRPLGLCSWVFAALVSMLLKALLRVTISRRPLRSCCTASALALLRTLLRWATSSAPLGFRYATFVLALLNALLCRPISQRQPSPLSTYTACHCGTWNVGEVLTARLEIGRMRN